MMFHYGCVIAGLRCLCCKHTFVGIVMTTQRKWQEMISFVGLNISLAEKNVDQINCGAQAAATRAI